MTDGGLGVQLSTKMLVESLLFASDGPVTIGRLASVLELSTEAVEAVLVELMVEYRSHGFRLERDRDQVQMVTAPESAPYVEKFLGLDLRTKLSPAALETLGIIAYRQPITRPQIETIRGVNCDGVLRTLLSYDLIQEVGRLEGPGRPILYGTTFQFLQYFGLGSLDELPPLEDWEDSRRKEP